MRNVVKSFIALVSLVFPMLLSGQGEGSIWYFGNNAGLDFNGGPPVPLLNGALVTAEGCATTCTPAGSLLLYTDGSSIWNRNHVTMPNGTGLLGNSTTNQAGIIVPNPGNPNLFYVFSLGHSGFGSLSYSEVDMNLQGGMGDVNGTKNVVLTSPTTEKLTACKHANGIDYWVITHLMGNNQFVAYRVTAAGVQAGSPVTTNVGLVHSGGADYNGALKVSPDGSKMALALWSSGSVELFDFDNSTGIPSNPRPSGPVTSMAYGIEFSPDSKILYMASEGSYSVYQYDLNAPNPWATQVVVGNVPAGGSYGALQLGPDDRIYMAQSGQPALSVINNPNTLGMGCNWQYQAINLGGRSSRWGLPTFISGLFNIPPVTFVHLCYRDSTQFTLADTGAVDSVSWNFDDPATGPANTSTAFHPWHIFSGPGTYNVEFIGWIAGISDTVIYQVIINPMPVVNLGPDVITCDTLLLDATNPGAQYIWQNGSTAPTYMVTGPGLYWVEAGIGSCIAMDSIRVDNILMALSLNDTALCEGSPLTLDPDPNQNYPGTAFSWSTGDSTATLSPTQSGNYWVAGELYGCRDTAWVQVSFGPAIVAAIDSFHNVTCFGDMDGDAFASASGGSGGLSILWDNNQTNPALTGLGPGSYTLTVTDSLGCTTTTTVTISEPPPVIAAFTSNPPLPLLLNVNSANLALSNTSQNATQYLWDFGDGNTSAQTSPNYTYTQVGNYCILLIASNDKGCPDTTQQCLEVFRFHIPNTFTPNNDAKNDVFEITGIEEYPDNEVQIFNRWGNLIYQAQPYNSDWNGTHSESGKDLSDGTYFYLFYPKAGEKKDVISGYVVILR